MSLASSSLTRQVDEALSPAAALPAERRGLLAIYMDLTKARLSALVVLTTAVGFVLASRGPIAWRQLLWTVLGTALAAGAASALNQLIEMRRDGLMDRTRRRPLPAGDLSRAHSLIVGVVAAYIGIAILALLVNLTAAALALATIIIYIALYTPLKPLSTLNTIVGAVTGALPPMIGWAAASGTLDPGAWVLAAILFLWQLPHFLALAWLYREDYARGGFRMLPAIDCTGQLTCRVAVLSSLALVPITLMLTLLHVTGWMYALGAIILGAALIWAAAGMLANLSNASARRLFLASILYLSLILPLMMVDRGLRAAFAGPLIAEGPTISSDESAADSAFVPTGERLIVGAARP